MNSAHCVRRRGEISLAIQGHLTSDKQSEVASLNYGESYQIGITAYKRECHDFFPSLTENLNGPVCDLSQEVSSVDASRPPIGPAEGSEKPECSKDLALHPWLPILRRTSDL